MSLKACSQMQAFVERSSGHWMKRKGCQAKEMQPLFRDRPGSKSEMQSSVIFRGFEAWIQFISSVLWGEGSLVLCHLSNHFYAFCFMCCQGKIGLQPTLSGLWL